MTEMLQEFFDSRGVNMRVDARLGVIHGVKILGLQSRNGRTYLPETLAAAAQLYENAKVNVNHPKGNPTGPRDYQDRIGAIRNVVVRTGEGLFADFHFNPKHVLAEQLAWDAEHAPENVGFSHNVQAQTTRRGRRVVVEAITKVQSVDLVADPATTAGLFESNESNAGKPTEKLTIEEICQEQSAELKRLRAEVERLEAVETVQHKHKVIRRLLREFQLPDPDADDRQSSPITSDRFIELLLAAEDEQAMRELVEERAALVRNINARQTQSDGRPLSRAQHFDTAAARLDAKGFVEAIT